MSNNSYDNKVSEKAVWEGVIPQEDEVYQSPLQKQNQPQMMFCYKCNNVIPGDSKFCPYCQIELYVTCPNCGVKYSSQYPICNQCGTNRDEYLENQRREEILQKQQREQKLKDARERKIRLKQIEREQALAYEKENDEIKKTKEYELIYSLFKEALIKRNKRIRFLRTIKHYGFIYIIISAFLSILLSKSMTTVYAHIAIFLVTILSYKIYESQTYPIDKQNKFLIKYISSNKYFDQDIANYLIKQTYYLTEDNLSDYCIRIYRKKNHLTIIDKWHLTKPAKIIYS